MGGTGDLASVHLGGDDALYFYHLFFDHDLPYFIGVPLEIPSHHLHGVPSDDGDRPFPVFQKELLGKV